MNVALHFCCSIHYSYVHALDAGTTDVLIFGGEENIVSEAGEYSVVLMVVSDEIIEDTEEFELVFTSDNPYDVFFNRESSDEGSSDVESNTLTVTVLDDDGAIYVYSYIRTCIHTA